MNISQGGSLWNNEEQSGNKKHYLLKKKKNLLFQTYYKMFLDQCQWRDTLVYCLRQDHVSAFICLFAKYLKVMNSFWLIQVDNGPTSRSLLVTYILTINILNTFWSITAYEKAIEYGLFCFISPPVFILKLFL